MDNMYNKMREMTTSGDIAYARGEVRTTPTSLEKEIVKDKSVRKNKETEEDMLARLKKKNEALDEQNAQKVKALKIRVMRAIDQLIGTVDQNLALEEFLNYFRVIADLTTDKVCIRAFKVEEDLVRLEKELPDDVGELELMLNAIRDKKPLAGYDPFAGFKYLFGARLSSQVSGVEVIYEGTIDLNLSKRENILINDADKADEVEEELTNLKQSRRVMFPVGGLFKPGDMLKIKDVLLTDKPEKEEKK